MILTDSIINICWGIMNIKYINVNYFGNVSFAVKTYCNILRALSIGLIIAQLKIQCLHGFVLIHYF